MIEIPGEIRELHKQYGVVVNLDQSSTEVPIIDVILPDLEKLPSCAQCLKCKREISTRLVDYEFPYRDEGIIVRFRNVRRYSVEGCKNKELMQSNDPEIRAILDVVDPFGGIEDKEAEGRYDELFEGCMLASTVMETTFPQGIIMSETNRYLDNRIVEGLKPRYPTTEDLIASLSPGVD